MSPQTISSVGSLVVVLAVVVTFGVVVVGAGVVVVTFGVVVVGVGVVVVICVVVVTSGSV